MMLFSGPICKYNYDGCKATILVRSNVILNSKSLNTYSFHISLEKRLKQTTPDYQQSKNTSHIAPTLHLLKALLFWPQKEMTLNIK